MDWDKFSFEYQLNLIAEEVVTQLISLEAYKEAAVNLCLPPDWREQLDKLNRVRAVYGTTALEGNPLSEAEVSQQLELLDQSSPDKASITKEQMQIRNSGVAQAWVRDRFHPGSAPIELTDILVMHKMVTAESDEKNNVPGRFRNFPVTVGSVDAGGVHRGAPYEHVPDLMHQYIEFINSRRLMSMHSVIKALLAHFFLVTIHPFGDGNGRVSRLVEAAILFQGGYNVHGFYGLSNYFYRNEREYKILLQKCRELHPFEVTPFIIFGIKGFSGELKGINNFIKTKLNRVVYRTTMVNAFNKRTGSRRRALNQREYHLLHFLVTETEPIDPFSESPSRQIKLSELRESPYVKAAYSHVTQRTFVRELTRLAQTGFIKFLWDEPSKDSIVELDFDAIGRY
jgi:Fic family protein